MKLKLLSILRYVTILVFVIVSFDVIYVIFKGFNIFQLLNIGEYF